MLESYKPIYLDDSVFAFPGYLQIKCGNPDCGITLMTKIDIDNHISVCSNCGGKIDWTIIQHKECPTCKKFYDLKQNYCLYCPEPTKLETKEKSLF